MCMNTSDFLEMKETILSISELNYMAKDILETSIGCILVRGEISNLAKPRSGHIYFTLKDSCAQVRCAMFRQNANSIKDELDEGKEIIATAHVSLYPERGDFQLIVQKIEISGAGRLQALFEQLKIKLQHEGLFAPELKKPIPKFIQSAAVITSDTGAAIQDILSVLKARWPILKLTLIPTLVQGDLAKTQIVKALKKADALNVETILLARGGGSIEDLWAFNEEIVARAIFECKTPIITGIGHETDFTIADFVSDLRAPTPTGAAQALTPNKTDILSILEKQEKQLIQLITRFIQQKNLHLDHLCKQVVHPKQKIQHFQAIIQKQIEKMLQSIQYCFTYKQNQLKACVEQLDLVNPAKILQRGYSITFNHANQPIKNAHEVAKGDIIRTQLADGHIESQVL